MNDLLEKSALEQGELLRAKELTSVELTALYLEQIALRNPELNAIVRQFGDRALRDARRKDAALQGGKVPDGLVLWGVPTAVKDLDLVRFSFTGFGSRSATWVWSPVDGASAKGMR